MQQTQAQAMFRWSLKKGAYDSIVSKTGQTSDVIACLRYNQQNIDLGQQRNKLHVGHEGGIKFVTLDWSSGRYMRKTSNVDKNEHNFQLGCQIFVHEYILESSRNSTLGKRGVKFKA